MDLNGTSFFVVTNGCIECRLEAAEIEKMLQETYSMKLCKDYSDAEIIVFLGCGVNQGKEDLSSSIIEIIKSKMQSNAKLLNMGCYATIRPDQAYKGSAFKELVDQVKAKSRFEGKTQEEASIQSQLDTDDKDDCNANAPYPEFWQVADEVFGSRDSSKLISEYCWRNQTHFLSKISFKLDTATIKLIIKYRRLIDKEIDSMSDGKTFCIRISTGCCGNCAYCSIKLTRGNVKSKPINLIIREFENGLKQGYTDFALLGTDVGDYGKDADTNLIELLEKIVSYEADFKLRLRNVNPRWLIPNVSRFCELLESNKVVYLLSPIESGSDRILKSMKRGYRANDYIEAIARIYEISPKLSIKTQIMVGFPDETHEDFLCSMGLFKYIFFDYFEVYAFTIRPGTAAAELQNNVDERTITKRYRTALVKSLVENPLRRLISKKPSRFNRVRTEVLK